MAIVLSMAASRTLIHSTERIHDLGEPVDPFLLHVARHNDWARVSSLSWCGVGAIPATIFWTSR